MTHELEPGIHLGVPDDDYHRLPYASASLLKVVRIQTLEDADDYLSCPPPSTPAMELGTALHAACLEPDSFADRFVQGLEIDRRSNANKELHAEFAIENAGKTVLKHGEFEQCRLMNAAVMRHPIAEKLLTGPGHSEVTIVWDDETHGLRCKCRIDRMVRAFDRNWLIDVKTTAGFTPPTAANPRWSGGLATDTLQREIGSRLYDLQAAHYMEGASAIADSERNFGFLWVTKPPMNRPGVFPKVRVTSLPHDAILEGREKRHLAMQRWALQADTPRGWPPVIEEVGIKDWDRVTEMEMDDGE